MNKRHLQQGFTIIELSIATLVFSVLLTICMTAFLNVGRLFVKGVNLSLTQQDARNIIDSISSDIRFSNSAPELHTKAGQSYFCIGTHRYKYMLNKHVNLTPPPDGTYSTLDNFGLVRQDVSTGCPPPAPSDDTAGSGVTHPVEMLSDNMQLNDLHFGQPPDYSCSENGKLCTITINLLFYGADDTVFTSHDHENDSSNPNNNALNDPDAHCFGSDLGSQFCASTIYTTSVLQSSQ